MSGTHLGSATQPANPPGRTSLRKDSVGSATRRPMRPATSTGINSTKGKGPLLGRSSLRLSQFISDLEKEFQQHSGNKDINKEAIQKSIRQILQQRHIPAKESIESISHDDANRIKRDLYRIFENGAAKTTANEEELNAPTVGEPIKTESSSDSEASGEAENQHGPNDVPAQVQEQGLAAKQEVTAKKDLEAFPKELFQKPHTSASIGKLPRKSVSHSPANSPQGSHKPVPESVHDFDSIYLNLDKPTRWTWSLEFVAAATAKKIKGVKSAFYSACSFLSKGPSGWSKDFSELRKEFEDWRLAHIWYGALSSGRGKNYQDIERSRRERDQNWAILRRGMAEDVLQTAVGNKENHVADRPQKVFSEGSYVAGLQHTQNARLKDRTEEIHKEMLQSILAMKQQLDAISKYGFGGRVDYLVRLIKSFIRRLWRNLILKSTGKAHAGTPVNLAETIEIIGRRHERLFQLGREQAVATSPEKMTSSEMILLRIAEELAELKESARKLCINSHRFGMIVDQLIQDQAIVEEIAAIIQRDGVSQHSGNASGTKDDEIDDILERRESNFTQLLRNCGFVKHKDADHVIRAIDYILNGLSNPRHKLNRALSCGGKISREDIPDVYAKMIQELPANREMNIDAGWGQGINVETRSVLFIAKGLFYKAADRLFRLHLGADRSRLYSLKIKKTEDETQITFASSAAVGLGSKLYVYFLKFAGPAYWAVSVKARHERRRNDALTLKFDNKSPVAFQKFLKGLLSGKLEDSYVLLKKAKSVATVHTSETGQTISALAYPGWSREFVDKDVAERRFETRNMLVLGGPAAYGGLSTDLLIRRQGRGFAYDSTDRVYNKKVRSEFAMPLISGMKLFGEAGVMPRAEVRPYTNDRGEGTGSSYLESAGVAGRTEGYWGFAWRPWGPAGAAGLRWKWLRAPMTKRDVPGSNIPAESTPRSFFSRIERYWAGPGGVASLKPSDYTIVAGEGRGSDEVSWDVAVPRNEKTLKLFKGSKGESNGFYDKVVDWVSYTTRESREEIATYAGKFQKHLEELADSIQDDNVSRKLRKLSSEIENLISRRVDFARHDDRRKFEGKILKIRERAEEQLRQYESKRGSAQSFDQKYGEKFKAAESLLEKLQNVSLWREEDLGDKMSIKLKLENVDLRDSSIRTIFKKMRKLRWQKDPEITGITGIGVRSYETEFNLPFLITVDSSAKLTLTRYENIYSGKAATGADSVA